MLPAEKQENQPSTAVANLNVPTPSSFGKVLGSIQGLQQRLNDFALDDVIGAETNLKTLMQQILPMRDRLDSIAELKNVVANANQLIHDIPEETFDLVGPDSLEKHPQLFAIVKASKLIRFHRLMKAARASADAVSFDVEAGQLHIDAVAPKIMPAPPQPEIIPQDNPAENKLAPETAVALTASAVQLGAEDSGQAMGIEAPAAWAFEAAQSEAKNSPTAGDETAANFTHVIADENAPVEAHAKVTDADDSANENWHTPFPPESPNDAAVKAPTRVETPAVALIEAPVKSLVTQASPIDAQTKTDFAEMARRNHLSRRQKKQARQKKLAETESKLDESKALVPANSGINQRLLDDLIESYGDFATTPNLPVPVQVPKLAKVKSVEPTVPPTPEFEKPLEDSRSAPNLQKAGELDRQLKKIIKDYGENDLYSKQSSVNLTTGGIAVFVVLGLLLGALYYFKAPTTVGSPQTHAVTQPSQPAPAMSPNTSSNDGRNGAGSSSKNDSREEPMATAKTATNEKK